MHPNRYPNDASQVGLVGTLLTGTSLTWFAPLLEKESQAILPLKIAYNNSKKFN
jgi:hypothetical protein